MQSLKNEQWGQSPCFGRPCRACHHDRKPKKVEDLKSLTGRRKPTLHPFICEVNLSLASAVDAVTRAQDGTYYGDVQYRGSTRAGRCRGCCEPISYGINSHHSSEALWSFLIYGTEWMTAASGNLTLREKWCSRLFPSHKNHPKCMPLPCWEWQVRHNRIIIYQDLRGKSFVSGAKSQRAQDVNTEVLALSGPSFEFKNCISCMWFLLHYGFYHVMLHNWLISTTP